jgi:hypothetical protein
MNNEYKNGNTSTILLIGDKILGEGQESAIKVWFHRHSICL